MRILAWTLTFLIRRVKRNKKKKRNRKEMLKLVCLKLLLEIKLKKLIKKFLVIKLNINKSMIMYRISLSKLKLNLTKFKKKNLI